MASSASKSAKTSKKPEKTPIIAVYQEKPDLRKKEPPLVDLQVSNPLTYLKSWWKRVMGREGIDFRFRIHPITAIAIAVILATFAFGVGRVVLYPHKPFFEFVPPATPTPTPIANPWRETAFSGALRFSGLSQKYYLITATSEAINLEVPENVDLSNLIGTRIFATGRFNEKTRTLVVAEATDLEILPSEVEPVPVVSPEPIPSPSPQVEEVEKEIVCEKGYIYSEKDCKCIIDPYGCKGLDKPNCEIIPDCYSFNRGGSCECPSCESWLEHQCLPIEK